MTEHTSECGHHRWCRCASRPGATHWAARCRPRPAACSGPGLRVAVISRWGRLGPARARAGLVPGPGRHRRVSLAWPRLPAAADVAIIAAGYFGYALVRLAVRASRPAATAHAAALW